MSTVEDFERKISDAWETEKANLPEGARERDYYDRIVGEAMADLYKSLPEKEADQIIYKSSHYQSMAITSALVLQRRIVLGLMDIKK